MNRVVTLPFEVDELARRPDGLDYRVYRAGDPTENLVDTELWVTPYLESVDYASIIPTMERLTVVQAQSAGTDHIAAWLPLGTTLCNARGVHDAATAEMAVALILASLRGVPGFVRAQMERVWIANNQAESLADKTVLIVGFGSIGQALGRRLEGFECDVIGVTRRRRVGTRPQSDLPDLLPSADVVVILVPLTRQSHHFVDVDFLGQMKNGALLVNMSRGPVVDSDALLTAVRQGRINAALDVTDPEPLPPDHELWRCESVIITPHVGGGTSAMKVRINRLIEEQLDRFATGLPPLNVVELR